MDVSHRRHLAEMETAHCRAQSHLPALAATLPYRRRDEARAEQGDHSVKCWCRRRRRRENLATRRSGCTVGCATENGQGIPSVYYAGALVVRYSTQGAIRQSARVYDFWW